MASFVERYTEKGKQEGILLGMEKGLLAGERQVLQRLLTRRFGPLSTQVQQRLDNGTAEELEMWAEKLLDAPSLQAVFE